MKLNCSRMETLVSGEPCTKSSPLEVTVLAEGSFTGRIKRTGGKTKPLGCINLLLIESKGTASEQLAICHADEKFLPERGASLVFPLLTGQEFGNVNRHGNVLTVHSTKLVLTLESLGDVDVESDHNIATTAGKWSRILSRLVFSQQARPEPRISASASGASTRSQGFGMGGLGISVQAPELALASNHIPRLPQSASNGSMSRSRQLVPGSLHSSSTKNFSDAPYSAPANLEQSSSLPQSQSLKRISLVLGVSDTDFGFGDDLKKILQSIDEPKNEPQPLDINNVPKDGNHNVNDIDTERLSKPSALTFLPPSAPFSDDLESDFSMTPSPNSIYLHPEAELSSLSVESSANSSRRIDLIMAKEQQQYAEKYGSRAATLIRSATNFSNTSVPADSSSIESNSRLPPQMPAPVVNDKIGDYTLSMEDLRETSTNGVTKVSRPTDITRELASSDGNSETQENLTRRVKTVHIAPEVSVINDSDGQSTIASSIDTDMKLPVSRSFSGKTLGKSEPRADSATKETKGSTPKFSKVMKKLLGKRKSKSNLSASTTSERLSEGNTTPELSNETESTFNLPAKTVVSRALPDEVSANPQEKADPPTPENLLKQGASKQHLYLNLAEQESSPVWTGTQTSSSLQPPKEDVDEDLNNQKQLHSGDHHNNSKRDKIGNDATKYHNENLENTAEVIATSNDNGCKTAAVPQLTNSTSALSFRSLSSRSLSARSLVSSNSLDHLASFINIGQEDQAADTSLTETLIESPQQKLRMEPVQEKSSPAAEPVFNVTPASSEKKSGSEVTTTSRDEKVSSPTLLRRESRQHLETVPISLDLDSYIKPPVSAARKMYESDNKSTSALPVKSASYSSFGSSRRSINSYSSGSSMSSIGSPRKGVATMFTAHMWGSIWNNNRWVPLSQLELPLEIVACDSASSARILVSGGASVNVDFTSDCEIRKVSHHDVEVRTSDATYMLRSRDAEIAQRLYRLLWSIQSNGVQPVLSSLSMVNTLTGVGAEILDENDAWACRRRTLMPPVLSKSNPNLNLSYMGRLTSTIIEE